MNWIDINSLVNEGVTVEVAESAI